MTTKEYFLPQSLDEAVGLLADHGPSLLVIAGGTLAMPLINEGVSMPETVIGLQRAGLNNIKRTNGSLAIGATTTLTRMMADHTIPLLQEAAHHIGGWSIRNMGTVGGNLFAPPPSGDFAVALLALDAQVKLVSNNSQRVLPLTEFYTGFMTTALQPNELVSEIMVPVPKGKTAYLKYGRRHANTPAIVTVAVHLILENRIVKDVRLGLNAVGPYPIRAEAAERVLIGTTFDQEAIAAAAHAAAEECQPFTDSIATEWYRRRMVGVYVRRALTQLAG